MRKILVHSNHYRVFSGFGKNMRNILRYLHSTGKYEIVELANNFGYSDVNLTHSPWKTIGSLPDDPKSMDKISQDPQLVRSASYGGMMIDKVIQDEKPDVYIGIEDPWAFLGYTEKDWWNKINCMIWTTLDSLPIYPHSIHQASKTDHYYVWASFAEKALHEAGQTHVKTLHGSIDGDNFIPLEEEKRQEMRRRNGIFEDTFVTGFVFRNQLRKSAPNILKGLRILKDQYPDEDHKVLFHTNWKEGWDIKREMEENKLSHEDVLTTYVCSKCKNYSVTPFIGHDKPCPHCGSQNTFNTVSIDQGIREDQLNEVFNMMDVYCHAFTSGGQEIPIQEAKLTGLITLVTDYSCGTDMSTEESGGFPLEWSEYKEPESQFIKATTHPSSIAKQIHMVKEMSLEKRNELGKLARQYILDNYEYTVIGKKLEEIIDSMPEVDTSQLSGDITVMEPDFQPDDSLDDLNWVISLYENILMEVGVDEFNDGVQHWIQRLSTDLNRLDVLAYFKQVAINHNSQDSKTKLEKQLSKDDDGRRIAISVPNDCSVAFQISFFLKELKKLYPKHNIYIFVDSHFEAIFINCKEVFKIIHNDDPSYSDHRFMEGAGDHKGYFEILFAPSEHSYMFEKISHNQADKTQFKIR